MTTPRLFSRENAQIANGMRIALLFQRVNGVPDFFPENPTMSTNHPTKNRLNNALNRLNNAFHFNSLELMSPRVRVLGMFVLILILLLAILLRSI